MTGYWKISYEETARSMKAIVNDTYGSADDLELRELETPAAGPDGVLVRVRAAAVNPLDWRLMRGKPFIGRLFFGLGLRRPKRRVLGVDVAGRVEAVGAEVTGVCSTGKLELVRSIGADHVVDYTAEDFTRNGQRYDVVLDVVGNRSLSDLRRVVTKKGTLVLGGGGSIVLLLKKLV